MNLHSPAHLPDPPCPYVCWPEGRLHWWFAVGLMAFFHYSPGALLRFPDPQRSSSCAGGGAEEAGLVPAPAEAPGAPETEPCVPCVGESVWGAEAEGEAEVVETAGIPARRDDSEGYGLVNCLRPPSPNIWRTVPSCSNSTCGSIFLVAWGDPSCGTEKLVPDTNAHMWWQILYSWAVT